MQILKEKIVRYETDGTIVKGYDAGELVRCKDCRYFETDHWEKVNEIPLIVAHEICTRWGGGCKTSLEGFCFMGEQNEERIDD